MESQSLNDNLCLPQPLVVAKADADKDSNLTRIRLDRQKLLTIRARLLLQDNYPKGKSRHYRTSTTAGTPRRIHYSRLQSSLKYGNIRFMNLRYTVNSWGRLQLRSKAVYLVIRRCTKSRTS